MCVFYRFIKHDIIDAANTSAKIIALDLEDDNIYVDGSKIDTGFKARRLLQNCKNIKPATLLNFRQQTKEMLKAVVKTFLHKSPLKYQLVRNLQWLRPDVMVSDAEKCRKQLRRTLNCLVDLQKFDVNRCDDVMSQFNVFIDSANIHGNTLEFTSFCRTKQRLDDFFYTHLSSDITYSALWNVVQIVLLLSHGQAPVERGFSINNDTMMINLMESSLVARRAIFDYVQHCGGIDHVSINKDMRLSCVTARSKYRLYLDQQRLEKQKDLQKSREKESMDNVEHLKCKIQRLQKESEQLGESANKLCDKAESSGNLKFLIEANALRRSAKEKKDTAAQLHKEVENAVKTVV